MNKDATDASESQIKHWLVLDDVHMAFRGHKYFKLDPIWEIIHSVRSLNSLELHVDSRALRLFEDAYEAGAKPDIAAE
ncbi:hypothetical protein [Xanthomonas phage JGB6]|nr:hypothetical protein [Xanthomonas phage JGB6]